MNEQKNNNQEKKPPVRPMQNGQRPIQNGQRPMQQRPMTGGQKPAEQRPAPNGQRPIPPSGARPQQPMRPSPAKRPGKEPTPPPRRRNEESYVFSRSLSETQDRILAERRERLEDAKKLRRGDVKDKLIKGGITFVASLIVIAVIATVIISASLNAGKIKKSKDAFVYKIGSNVTELAYKDAVQNGAIYISMNSVAELCQLTVSGNTGSELRFYTESGSYVSFTADSSVAMINGYGIDMSAPAKISGTECAVPLDFLDTILGGVEISLDRQKNTITIKRLERPDSTHLEPRYESVSFMLKTNGALSAIDENKYFNGKPLFEFKTDLSAYESYMNPSGDQKDAFLMLLNKETPCDANFAPQNLVTIPAKWVNPSKSGWVTLELDGTAMKALEAMLLEMRAEGFGSIFITSAYRSYSYQSGLYNTYIQNELNANPSLTFEEAKAIVETYSAVPGYSEHHTGLCVDFITTDMTDLTNEFAEKEVYDWLLANAWKFGFVLRYPEDKVDVTGYSYESWHWRYVGRSHALEMLKTGMCFDEYVKSLK